MSNRIARRGARLLAATLLAAAALVPPAGDRLGLIGGAAAAACDGGPAAQGIDVSTHQGKVDWAAVAGSGIRFGMARIADGLTFPDATFLTNYAGMRANGITPGSYLFFEPGQDAVAQANAVVAALTKAGFRIGDLPPAIDVEVTGGQSPATIAAKVRTAITTIQAALGVTPFIYASPAQWNRIVDSPEFGDVPLWIAHWQVPCPTLPRGWQSWALWQRSSTGTVPGIAKPVDLDQSTGADLPVYTGAPVFPGLVDRTVYAVGPAAVTFPVRAVGFNGASVAASCDPAPGSTFVLGTSTVTCTATNQRGTTTRSFRLTLQLAAPPAWDATFPRDVTVVSAGPNGAPVAFGPVTARNYDGGRLPATCTPAPASAFAAGRTAVTCVATDSFGRSVTRGLTVTVGYRVGALGAPLVDPVTAASPMAEVTAGSAVPVRFGLLYADGTPVADAEGAAIASACGALVWLAPSDGLRVTTGGTLASDGLVLACARYDAAARQLVADLGTAGLPAGPHTILVTVTDREGVALGSRLAAVAIR